MFNPKEPLPWHIFLGLASCHAYSELTAIPHLYEGNPSWSFGAAFEDPTTSTEAFTLLSRDQRHAVVAFRGSQEGRDFLTDFKAMVANGMTPAFGGHGAALGALLDAWGSVRARVRAWLEQNLRPPRGGTPLITFTGHSLGGALALIATEDALSWPNFATEVVVFGAPPVGDARFAERVGSAAVAAKAYVDANDWIIAVAHVWATGRRWLNPCVNNAGHEATWSGTGHGIGSYVEVVKARESIVLTGAETQEIRVFHVVIGSSSLFSGSEEPGGSLKLPQFFGDGGVAIDLGPLPARIGGGPRLAGRVDVYRVEPPFPVASAEFAHGVDLTTWDAAPGTLLTSLEVRAHGETLVFQGHSPGGMAGPRTSRLLPLARNEGLQRARNWSPPVTQNGAGHWRGSVTTAGPLARGLSVRGQTGYGIIDMRCFTGDDGDRTYSPWTADNHASSTVFEAAAPPGHWIERVEVKYQSGYGIIDVRMTSTDGRTPVLSAWLAGNGATPNTVFVFDALPGFALDGLVGREQPGYGLVNVRFGTRRRPSPA